MTREEAYEYIYDLVNEDEIDRGGCLLIDKIFNQFEAQLKAKDEEIELLKQCVEEAIKRPMGVEPSLYSDYKMLKDTQ